MKYLYFWWWRVFPSVNLRVFQRACSMESHEARMLVAKTAFDKCTKREQDYIIWRVPMCRHFLEKKDNK